MDKNLQAVLKEAKSFILPILHRLAPRSLVPDKHHVLNDLPFNEVACATDSQAYQDRLKQKEKKKSEGDSQVSSAYQLFSLQLQRPSSYQKEEGTCHSACSEGKDIAIHFPIFSFHFVFLSVFIFFGYQHRVGHKSWSVNRQHQAGNRGWVGGAPHCLWRGRREGHGCEPEDRIQGEAA